MLLSYPSTNSRTAASASIAHAAPASTLVTIAVDSAVVAVAPNHARSRLLRLAEVASDRTPRIDELNRFWLSMYRAIFSVKVQGGEESKGEGGGSIGVWPGMNNALDVVRVGARGRE